MIEVVGIVISDTPYRETSKLIKILTKEYGVISCIAKGARSLKSDLRSVSSKLAYANFHIHYKENGLSTLISGDIVDSLKVIRKNIEKITYASFILDLTEQIVQQSKSKEIFDLMISAIKKINENYDSLVITHILELKYLEFLGVMPILDECSVCGSKTSIKTLSSIKGGYVCSHCLNGEFIVDEKTIKLIRVFYYVDIDKITNTHVSEKIKDQINCFLDDYYDRYTGIYLKSKIFLSKLNKIN